MLISKRTLDSVIPFAGKDDVRDILNGIRLESSGKLIATDGHMLGIFTPGAPLPDTDFPNVGQLEGDQPPLEPCTLAIDGIQTLAKAIPKKNKMPIVKHALLDHAASNANGKAVFHVTDLDNPQRVNVAKLDGNFPQYDQVLPKDEPVYRMALDAALLSRLIKAADAVRSDNDMTLIEFEFFASHSSPLRATVTNKDGDTLTAVVMPLSSKCIDNKKIGLLIPHIAEPVRSEIAS